MQNISFAGVNWDSQPIKVSFHEGISEPLIVKWTVEVSQLIYLNHTSSRTVFYEKNNHSNEMSLNFCPLGSQYSWNSSCDCEETLNSKYVIVSVTEKKSIFAINGKSVFTLQRNRAADFCLKHQNQTEHIYRGVDMFVLISQSSGKWSNLYGDYHLTLMMTQKILDLVFKYFRY